MSQRPPEHPRDSPASDDPTDQATDDAEALSWWFAEGLDDAAVWRDLEPGPPVLEVAERLSSLPRPFLAEDVDLLAVAGDVVPHLVPGTRGDPLPDLLSRIEEIGHAGMRAGAAAVLWVHASAELLAPFSPALRDDRLYEAVAALALRFGSVVPASTWLTDAERREEAARLLLTWSGQHPADESLAEAVARFEMRDTVRRRASLARAAAEHRHRLEVQQRLDAERAREAAARYNTE